MNACYHNLKVVTGVNHFRRHFPLQALVQEGSGGLGGRRPAARHLLANWAETTTSAKLCCRLGASVRLLAVVISSL